MNTGELSGIRANRNLTAPRSILIVGNFLSSHGSSRGVCEELADRLKHNGWKIYTTSSRPHRITRLQDMVCTTIRRRDRFNIAQIDVYSGPAFFWAEAVCWTLRRLRKPYILTLHGGNLPAFARRWPGRVRHLLGSAALVTAPSRYLQHHMQPYRDDLLLLPNPVDLTAYHFRLRSQPEPKLIWLRAFHEIYNPELAIKAAERLVDSFPLVNLTMVGPDKGDGSFQRAQALAEAGTVSDRVALVGGVPKQDVPTWLQKGDIFLNTTNVDNTPVSVIEAMACGLCVVSTDVGGIPYLLTHDHDALLVPPNDPEAMAAAVRRILTEPGLAERLSRNARATAEQFDWSIILPQWEALLMSVVEAEQ